LFVCLFVLICVDIGTLAFGFLLWICALLFCRLSGLSRELLLNKVTLLKVAQSLDYST
jgi:hypothetical protein